MKVTEAKERIQKVIVGQDKQVTLLLTALIAGGHVLLEDMPGTGKTMLSKTMAKVLGGKFSRIQFTPDLLPVDVTGLNVYDAKENEFIFHEGPVFCNILLADEINRATPRTQSSLLECMEERQVTIDGVTRKLEEPFLVIATQNPIETAGTYVLPEAQMDRFLMQLSMSALTAAEEIEVLRRFGETSPLEEITAGVTVDEVKGWMKAASQVFVHDELLGYIQKICETTRQDSEVLVGVSPRGSLALLKASKAYAYSQGRNYVVPEDIKELAVPVLAHRIVLQSMMGSTKKLEDKVSILVDGVKVPTEEWKTEGR